VSFEVVGELIDALGQARNLHVRASSVFVMQRHAAYGGLGHISGGVEHSRLAVQGKGEV